MIGTEVNLYTFCQFLTKNKFKNIKKDDIPDLIQGGKNG